VLTVRQILLVCVCALTPASAASAKTWPARFVSINDGDTIDARVGGHVYTIRTSGIQAMEQHHYSADPKKRTGECNAVEATARLEQLIHESHGQLRLSAQDPSSHAGHRLRRNIAVRIRGRWLDTGLIEIREGHALWMSGKEEDKWNRAYNLAEQRARIDGKGLWDPTHCGVGPYQDVPLRLWVNWDPPGIDNLDVNGEFIKIQNQGTRTVDLSHWWVRDSMLERYTFPSGAQLPPGATVTVRTGHGTNTAGTFYWGRDSPVFENALGPNSPEGANRGDGGYLFDPQGDLRGWDIYRPDGASF
jgi:endonuclease YncB( thermonuclease family)